MRHLKATTWLAIAAGWMAFGFVVALQNWLGIRAENALLAAHGLEPRNVFTLWQWVVNEFSVWLPWALITPGIVLLSRALPIAGDHRWRNLILHAVIGPLAVSLALVLSRVVRLVVPSPLTSPIVADAGFWVLVDLILRKYLVTFLIFYAIIIAIDHAIQYYRAFQSRAVRAAQLETMLAQSQLDVLKMQLHPHFLFNTLHAISALMATDVQGARRMIARLSDLLRLSLDDDVGQEVTLEEELGFLQQYLDIQKVRFRNRLEVEMRVDPEARAVLVPRLLLQPLVENAIRHGMERHARTGRIEVEAHLAEGVLRLGVCDNGPGLPPNGVVREGVGLRNTRGRLEALYGDDHGFALENRPGGGLRVSIALPARQAAEERTLEMAR